MECRASSSLEYCQVALKAFSEMGSFCLFSLYQQYQVLALGERHTQTSLETLIAAKIV